LGEEASVSHDWSKFIEERTEARKIEVFYPNLSSQTSAFSGQSPAASLNYDRSQTSSSLKYTQRQADDVKMEECREDIEPIKHLTENQQIPSAIPSSSPPRDISSKPLVFVQESPGINSIEEKYALLQSRINVNSDGNCVGMDLDKTNDKGVEFDENEKVTSTPLDWNGDEQQRPLPIIASQSSSENSPLILKKSHSTPADLNMENDSNNSENRAPEPIQNISNTANPDSFALKEQAIMNLSMFQSMDEEISFTGQFVATSTPADVPFSTQSNSSKESDNLPHSCIPINQSRPPTEAPIKPIQLKKAPHDASKLSKPTPKGKKGKWIGGGKSRISYALLSFINRILFISVGVSLQKLSISTQTVRLEA
jgi:hypothetical protein